MLFFKLQNILFALQNIEKEITQPTNKHYSTLEARKIQDAIKILKEALELVKR